MLAIERFGQDSGGRGFAHAPRPGEQIRVADPIGGDRVAQRLGDVFLADQFPEDLRPIPPGHDDVLVRGVLVRGVAGRFRGVRSRYGRGHGKGLGIRD